MALNIHGLTRGLNKASSKINAAVVAKGDEQRIVLSKDAYEEAAQTLAKVSNTVNSLLVGGGQPAPSSSSASSPATKVPVLSWEERLQNAQDQIDSKILIIWPLFDNIKAQVTYIMSKSTAQVSYTYLECIDSKSCNAFISKLMVIKGHITELFDAYANWLGLVLDRARLYKAEAEQQKVLGNQLVLYCWPDLDAAPNQPQMPSMQQASGNSTVAQSNGTSANTQAAVQEDQKYLCFGNIDEFKVYLIKHKILTCDLQLTNLGKVGNKINFWIPEVTTKAAQFLQAEIKEEDRKKKEEEDRKKKEEENRKKKEEEDRKKKEEEGRKKKEEEGRKKKEEEGRKKKEEEDRKKKEEEDRKKKEAEEQKKNAKVELDKKIETESERQKNADKTLKQLQFEYSAKKDAFEKASAVITQKTDPLDKRVNQYLDVIDAADKWNNTIVQLKPQITKEHEALQALEVEVRGNFTARVKYISDYKNNFSNTDQTLSRAKEDYKVNLQILVSKWLKEDQNKHGDAYVDVIKKHEAEKSWGGWTYKDTATCTYISTLFVNQANTIPVVVYKSYKDHCIQNEKLAAFMNDLYDLEKNRFDELQSVSRNFVTPVHEFINEIQQVNLRMNNLKVMTEERQQTLDQKAKQASQDTKTTESTTNQTEKSNVTDQNQQKKEQQADKINQTQQNISYESQQKDSSTTTEQKSSQKIEQNNTSSAAQNQSQKVDQSSKGQQNVQTNTSATTEQKQTVINKISNYGSNEYMQQFETIVRPNLKFGNKKHGVQKYYYPFNTFLTIKTVGDFYIKLLNIPEDKQVCMDSSPYAALKGVKICMPNFTYKSASKIGANAWFEDNLGGSKYMYGQALTDAVGSLSALFISEVDGTLGKVVQYIGDKKFMKVQLMNIISYKEINKYYDDALKTFQLSGQKQQNACVDDVNDFIKPWASFNHEEEVRYGVLNGMCAYNPSIMMFGSNSNLDYENLRLTIHKAKGENKSVQL